MAKKILDIEDDCASLEERTIRIDEKLDHITTLLAGSARPSTPKLEVSTSTPPSEAETEPEHFPGPGKISVAFVAKHISDNYHSRHLITSPVKVRLPF